MITKLLKSLSDTELTSIAKELNDPNIDNISIYRQLIAKINPSEITDVSFITDFTSQNSRAVGSIDSAVTNLVCKVALELSDRLLEKDKDAFWRKQLQDEIDSKL